MENRQAGFDYASLYPIETLLKGFFIFMSLFNLNYTLLVAFLASFCGVLRVCKTPQLNLQYLQRVLSNNHGQNIFYITVGGIGFVNYLFYAPISLFFAYGIVEYIKIKYPNSQINYYGQIVRNNRYSVFETKAILEIIFFVFLILTLPFDFGGRIIKLFLMGQFLLVKYKVNAEFRKNCTTINVWIQNKLSAIPAVGEGYQKLAGTIYNYASKDIQGQ